MTAAQKTKKDFRFNFVIPEQDRYKLDLLRKYYFTHRIKEGHLTINTAGGVLRKLLSDEVKRLDI